MIKRKIEKRLLEYYFRKEDPILVVDGARQIGKTFIIRETASKYFKNYVEINLKDDFDGYKIFNRVKNINDFYIQLTSLYGDRLNNNDDTIVFLDEIQVYPHLLSMLKALKLDNRYRYIASGSLLGITLRQTFIPMGSINEIKMYPVDFEEFLIAMGCGYEVIEYLKKCFINREHVDDSLHNTILQRFKEYLITGGLPAAVNEFITTRNIFNVRNIQNNIYSGYKNDASQYDITNKLKIRNIYELLPSYMENKVKRVVFNQIEEFSRSNLAKYQDEFNYLIYSGCTIPTRAISNPKFPLIESASKNLIKLYYNDVGILSGTMYKTNTDSILNKESGVNLGSCYETACAMELLAHGHDLFYFDRKKVGEVDFLINDYDNLTVLPIEIKSGNDQNNFRAIPKLVKEPYSLKQGYIFGNKNIIEERDNLITFPIYMIMFV